MRTNFKQIPKGWQATDIGLIPEDWEVKNLREASDIIMGQSPPSSTYNTENIGLPFYQGKTDFGSIYPSPRIWCTSPTKISRKDDILISVRAPVGPVNIATEECGIGRGLSIIRANINDYRYIFFYLKNIEKEIGNLGSGSTFKAINKNQLHNIKISLPPLPEQKKIAYILSKIQQAIETQEQIIKTTQELKKALMQKLFTEGLNGEQQKQTEIGPIPESWEVKKLNDVSDIIMGQSPPSSTYNTDGIGLPFYQGKTDFGNIYPSPRVWCTSPSKISQKNDILISVRAPVGPVNISIEECGIGRGLSIIRSNRNDYRYIYFYLQNIEKEIEKLGSGSTFKAINKNQLHNIKISIPPLTEQIKIGDALFKLEDKIIVNCKNYDELKDLFSSMLNQLMTGQIRVKDIDLKVPSRMETVQSNPLLRGDKGVCK